MPKEGVEPKIRAPYSSQACTICRSKKSKCDGVKPVCGSCEVSGRANECVWGKASASRKPRTEAHFEALRRRVDLLEGYVERLEAMLAKCVCQNATTHVQFRPSEPPSEYSEKEDSDPEDLLDSDEEIAQDLYAPMQSLKLDDRAGGLFIHGITLPVRLDSQEVSQRPESGEPDASYILCVDGMDIAHCHPNIDWSRHLPPDVSLDRREHDEILAFAFKFLTMWCLRVMPSLFLRDMYRALSAPRSESPPRTPNYSPLLHNAILSISAVYSDNPYLRDPKTRELFAKAAKASLETECQKPTICLVPALAFVGSYHADAGDRFLADLFFSMSTKISMDLGLAVDCTVWVNAGLISREEMLARNWAHWTIYAMDVAWALFFGRDFFGAPADRRTVPPPHVDSEFDQLAWYHAPAKIPPQPNYLTLVFFHSSSLFAIARKIIDILNNLATARQDFRQVDEQITIIDLELHKWKSDLPAPLDLTLANKSKSTPQRLMLHCQYWWCFIVLHRPFFNRRSHPTQVHLDGQIDHVKLCLRAAENIMEVLETWSQIYTLGLTPLPLVQIMFGAGTVFLLRALQSTASPRIAYGALQTALAQVKQCIEYMREMGRTFRSATRTANMLQALLNDKLQPIIARRLTQKGVPVSALGSSALSAPGTSSSSAAGPPQSAAPAPGPSSSLTSTPESHSSPGGDGERLTTELMITSTYPPVYDLNHLLPTSVPAYPSWTNAPHVPQNIDWSQQQTPQTQTQTNWSQQSQTATTSSSQNPWSQQHDQTPPTWDFIPQYSESDHDQSGFQYEAYPTGEDNAYPELDPDMSAFMGLPGFDRFWAQDAGNLNVRPPNVGFPAPPVQLNNNYASSGFSV